MKQAGLGDFENPYADHELGDVNLLRYRNVCPTCGHKGRKTGEGRHDNPWTGLTYFIETYSCENNSCDESSYYA